MTTHKRICQRSFTLVEMLVVMAIIAILAAILLPAIRSAVSAAKNNRIAQELSSLHQAVEAYKMKFGDYPPDFSSVQWRGAWNTPWNPATGKGNELFDSNNIVVRHLRKAFPRHTENLPAFFVDSSGNTRVPDQAEALVSWLSQLKNDPRKPLTSSTLEKHILFSFDESRLKDPDNDGLYSYVPKDGKDMPYVYFDSRTYGWQVVTTTSPPTTIRYSSSYAVIDPGTGQNLIDSSDANTNPKKWVYLCPYNSAGVPTGCNPTTFQIISAGLDGDYGNTLVGSNPSPTQGNTPPPTVPVYKSFPTNPSLTYVPGDWDNITNFSEGKILEDHMP
ncbi:MAG: prepilin-type N-terminal cleavage/methylation domain-containing protein [Planctomycetota bacterium]|nr:prepilin-type N-terminal cleavage/methylation domain-containing protein [Planctomycetota bacterium]